MSAISIETKKISELNLATEAVDNDLLILRKSDGTGVKAISVANSRSIITGPLSDLDTTDKDSIVDAVNEVLAKVIQSTRVPMENLGTAVTAEQLSYIKNGEGYQLGLGSYWDDQAQGIVWRIWDFDKFYNTGDTALKTRNACVLPDANLIHADGSTHYMNDTDTTENGYNGTKYRSTYRSQCRTKFANFFGSAHIVTHRELLSNAVSNGAASGFSWYDCDVELPPEEMMLGHGVWGTSTIGGQGGHNVGNSWGRLALSLLKPEFVCNRENYWLRNVVSASRFANVYADGAADCHHASDASVGFRPFALIS